MHVAKFSSMVGPLFLYCVVLRGYLSRLKGDWGKQLANPLKLILARIIRLSTAEGGGCDVPYRSGSSVDTDISTLRAESKKLMASAS